MTQSLDIVILSVPFTEPLPMVAPVLLSACLNQGGVSAKGVDFGVEFYKEFTKKPYWAEIKAQLTLGQIQDNRLPKRAVIDMLKFNMRFLKNLKQYDPKWIGLSIFTTESINYSYILAYSIKKYLPNVKIVIGGKGSEITCSVRNKTHSQIYIDSGIATLAVVGDCEHVIADLIKQNKTGVYVSSQQTKEDLDQTPIPNWDEYDLIKYSDVSHAISEPYMAITASKGCVRNCTFCDVSNFWPKYLYRDPEKVAREIIVAYEKTGIKDFLFTDNLINGSVSNYRAFNKILAEEIPGKISYQGQAIFRDKDNMPEDDFILAKKAGCKVWSIGVESGSERVRFDLGKKITDNDLDWSVTQLAAQGIGQWWLMIVGYPTETEEDFKLTLELFKKYAHLGRQGLVKPSITPTFMLLNNSPLMQNIKLRDSLGLAHNVGNTWSGKFWTSTKNTDNTFPIRAERWRTAIRLLEDLGYATTPQSHDGYKKWAEEINSFEKIYNDNKHTFIPISQI